MAMTKAIYLGWSLVMNFRLISLVSSMDKNYKYTLPTLTAGGSVIENAPIITEQNLNEDFGAQYINPALQK